MEPRLLALAADAKSTDGLEVLLREDRVVVCPEATALPPGHLRRQQALGAQLPLVPDEVHPGSAGVVGVLHHLLEETHIRGVVLRAKAQ